MRRLVLFIYDTRRVIVEEGTTKLTFVLIGTTARGLLYWLSRHVRLAVNYRKVDSPQKHNIHNDAYRIKRIGSPVDPIR